MRVFLDANILFSAARSDGAIRRLVGLLREAGHTCCVDAFVIEEARRNLAAKAPAAQPELDSILATMAILPILPPDRRLLKSLPLPEKDRPVLAAAILGACDALVTGDRSHFGLLFGTSVRGAAVYSPAEAAAELLE
ncbi:MAG: PIN domain-containing protein [Verrucomicrobiales bacterium]